MRRFLHVLLVSLFIGGGLPFLEEAVSRASNPACNPQIETESSHGRANVVEVWFKDVGTCDWQVPNGVLELYGAIVGGGGAGAGKNTNGNRGGDGGEVVDFTSNSLGSTLTINVGAGGTGTSTSNASGGSGSASSIDNQGTLSIAQGGAGGVSGYGSGAGWSGVGAGGGAASGNSQVGVAGANGQTYSRFPSYTFGGGGGSGVYYASAGTYSGGSGGMGGGGAGGSFESPTGSSATPTHAVAGGINTGGGGGGAPNFANGYSWASGNGGSGVVLLEYSTYTASFDSQGGSSVSSGTFFGGGTLAAPSAPTRANYSFQGWSLTPSGSTISFPYTPASYANFTLYAQWQQTHATITFNANGGSGSDTTQIVPLGVATALDSLPFTRSSYTFQGWTEASGGSGTVYLNEGLFTASGNVTLYAQWQAGTIAAPTVTESSSASPTNIDTRTFTFSGVAGATFSCTLNGVTDSNCTSPLTVGPLSDGNQSFEVFQSWNGNDSLSVQKTWTVDTTPPTVAITSTRPTALASTPSFTFSGEAGLTYTCSLDGVSTSCTSGWTASSLSDGAHTFSVSQTDPAGNVGTASQNWTTDRTAPNAPTSLTLQAASNSGDVRDLTTNIDSPTMVIQVAESGGTLDLTATHSSAPSQSCSASASQTSLTCSFSSLADGDWAIVARQTDAAGNQSASTTATVTIDTVAPSAPTGLIVTTTDASSRAIVSFSVSPDASGLCREVSGSEVACTSPYTTQEFAAGSYTYQVVAVDAAGNRSSAVTEVFTITRVLTSTPSRPSSRPAEAQTQDSAPAVSAPIVPVRRQLPPEESTVEALVDEVADDSDGGEAFEIELVPEQIEAPTEVGNELTNDPPPAVSGGLLSALADLFSPGSPLTPSANSAIGASGDDSIIVPFDPHETIASKMATANLVGATAAIAGIVAAAGAAAAGAASAGMFTGSSSSSLTSAGGSQAGLRGAAMNEDSLDALAFSDYTIARAQSVSPGKGDQARRWRSRWVTWWDRPSIQITRLVAPLSPLSAKLANDAAYLRAMTGSFSLFVPIAAVGLAVSALGQGQGILLHPPVELYLAMMLLGVFDAFAGSLAMVIFVAGSLPLMDFGAIEDWRLLAGIIVSGFGPIVVARSIRDFRRVAIDPGEEWWVRLGDIAFASLMGGWVAGLIVRALPALTGLTVPAANYVIVFQVWATLAIGARVLLETVAARRFPQRVNSLSPSNLPEPPRIQKIVAQVGRFGFYIFVASSFMGFGPVVLAAGLMFLTPTILSELAHRFPTSTTLWRILPTGLAGLAMILGLEIVLEQSLTVWIGDHPEFSTIFIVTLLGLITTVTVLGIVARAPSPSIRHWTERSDFRRWRRIGAVGIFAVLLLFTGML